MSLMGKHAHITDTLRESYIISGGAEDLHQHVLVGARALHRLPQLLHSVDDGRVQHGQDGFLKVSRQLALQNIH